MKKAILMSAMIGLTSMCVNAQVVVDNNYRRRSRPYTECKRENESWGCGVTAWYNNYQFKCENQHI